MFPPSLVPRRVIANLIRIGTQLCGDEFNQILWRDFRGAEWPAGIPQQTKLSGKPQSVMVTPSQVDRTECPPPTSTSNGSFPVVEANDGPSKKARAGDRYS